MIKLDKVKSLGYTNFYEGKRFNVLWQPNRFCNYDCSYCWPSSHTREKDFVDTEISLAGIDNLCEQLHNRKTIDSVNWGWSGGEPTFHPGFLKFLERITSHNNKFKQSTNITTNLSQSLLWWSEFLDVAKKFNKVQVNASLHQEFVDTEIKVNRFRDKMLFLKDNGIKVVINQVLTPFDFEETKEYTMEVFKDLGLEGINFKMDSQIVKRAKDNFYTEEQWQFFEQENLKGKLFRVEEEDGTYHTFSSPERFKSYDFLNFKGWTCYAGYSGISIKHETVVRGVGACRDEVLGTFSKGFELFDIPRPCFKNKKCNCAADLKMPKFK